jgi:FkbM family methyltransferase
MSALVTRAYKIGGRDFAVRGDPADHYFAETNPDFTEHDRLFELLAPRHPRCIVDIGANVGLFALGAHASFPEARLVAFEPHPMAFKALQENAGPFADLGNYALGAKAGTMRFYPGGPMNAARSSGAHLMGAHHWQKDAGIEVTVSTLDAEVERRNLDAVDLVKIDVEGFEMDVLRGAQRTVERFAPIVFMEFNAWALMQLGNINPRMLLDHAASRFRFVYHYRKDAAPTRLVTGEDRKSFLHDHLLLRGCVDDLILSGRDLHL